MSDKSFGDMLRELDEMFDDAHAEFVDDFIENKARPHVMMYFRDWFDEQVAPELRESLQEEKPEVAYAKRLASFLSGIREGIQGFVLDVVQKYVDVPNFKVKRTPVSEVEADELNEEQRTVLAAIQHAIDNHNYRFLNQEILTDITGYNSNYVFDYLRVLEENGYITRTRPETHPPGIHHMRKAYSVEKRLADPDSVVNPLSVNEVMGEVADDLADKVHQEVRQRSSDELLAALQAEKETIRQAPLEVRQEAYDKIREHLNQ